MGVKGLKKLLQRAAEGQATETLPPASLSAYIVDASGFLIDFICAMITNPVPAITHRGELRADIPSDYSMIAESLHEYFKQLWGHDANGDMIVEFYFDGSKTKFPAKREEREKRIREAWNDLWNSVHSSSASRTYKNNLRNGVVQHILPTLMMDELIAVLIAENIPYVECDYEADQAIAKRCAQLNEGLPVGQEIAVIVGNDTDFLAMRGCLYVWLEDFTPCLPPGGNPHPGCYHPVTRAWRRAGAAAALGLSESEFVDFCLLLGNDYTSLHKRTLLDALYEPGTQFTEEHFDPEIDFESYISVATGKLKKSMAQGGGDDRADALLAIVKMCRGAPGGKPRVRSTHSADLQYAIDFSYAMYNLEDIDSTDKWPDHHEPKDNASSAGASGGIQVYQAGEGEGQLSDDDDDNNNDDDNEGKGGNSMSQADLAAEAQSGISMRLTSKQKTHLQAWSHKHAATLGRVNLQADVCAYLKEAIRKDRVFGGADGDVTEVHLRAFEICCKLIPMVEEINGWFGQEPNLEMFRTYRIDHPRDNYYEDRGGMADLISWHKLLVPGEAPLQDYLERFEEDDAVVKYGGWPVHRHYFLWAMGQKLLAEAPGMPNIAYAPLRYYHNRSRELSLEEPLAVQYDRGMTPDGMIFVSELPADAELPVRMTALGREPKDLHWPTLKAGVLIEGVLRTLLRMEDKTPPFSRRDGLEYTYDRSACRPSSCFNAELFHVVVRQLEGEGYGRDQLGNKVVVFDDFLMNSGYDQRVQAEREALVKQQEEEDEEAAEAAAAAASSEGEGVEGEDGDKKRKNKKQKKDKKDSKASAVVVTPSAATLTLPIHGHREEILTRIGTDRVTVIHGETGCGKSSGLPLMLLDHAEANGAKCLMFVSQPRRIAAASLAERLKTTHGDQIGLRMGHGLKEETSGAKVIFVTTGYLVRLLAHHPENFRHHTHLIIDEVHERSVDGDVLCMLARRLLHRYSHIKLILMSATIHTSLYTEYFSPHANDGAYFGSLECLSVGVTRFPKEIFHLDDIMGRSGSDRGGGGKNGNGGKRGKSALGGLSPKHMDAAQRLAKAMEKIKSYQMDDGVPADIAKMQYALAEGLVMSQVPTGTGVLIFVSGINDITDLLALFDQNEDCILVPIHSDVPYEEQRLAMEPTPKGKIKVIIATNAAESSITVPDCDTVICLGTHKALKYIPRTHRVALVNSWISQASATQRAGRTGRVRPGKVIRLYSEALFSFMEEHEPCEVTRVPGQDLILQLRSMFEESDDFEGVVPILDSLLQPPDTGNIERSFDVLYAHRMITDPGDEGYLTDIGRMAGSLPVDLSLGRMIALGVLMGVGAEMCILSIALSLPKTVFRQASPHVHRNPDELYYIYRHTFIGAKLLDGGTYSEPIMLLRLYLLWTQDGMRSAPFEKRLSWCEKYGLVTTRAKQFVSECDNILGRLRDSLKEQKLRLSGGLRSPRRGKMDESEAFPEYLPATLVERYPEATIDSARLNRMRLVLSWSLEDNLIQLESHGLSPPDQKAVLSVDVQPKGSLLTSEHLKTLLPAAAYPELPELASGISFGEQSRSVYQGKLSTERFATSAFATLAAVLAEKPKRLVPADGVASSTEIAFRVRSPLPNLPAIIVVDSTKCKGDATICNIHVLWHHDRVVAEMGSAPLNQVFTLGEGSKASSIWLSHDVELVQRDLPAALTDTSIGSSLSGYGYYSCRANANLDGANAGTAPEEAKVGNRIRKNFKSWFECAPCDRLSKVMLALPEVLSVEAILSLHRVEYTQESVEIIFHTAQWNKCEKSNMTNKIADKKPRVTDRKAGVSQLEFFPSVSFDDAPLRKDPALFAESLGSPLVAEAVGITDASLPLRLLHCYQMSSTEKRDSSKSIVLWKEQPDNTKATAWHKLPKQRSPFLTPADVATLAGINAGGKSSSSSSLDQPVVGSAQWKDNKDRERANAAYGGGGGGGSDNYQDDIGEGEKMSVMLSFATSNRQKGEMVALTRSREKAILSQNGFHGSVSHNPAHYEGTSGLHVVAGTSLDVGKNQDFVFCDKLTYLPPGALWLELARHSSTRDLYKMRHLRMRLTNYFDSKGSDSSRSIGFKGLDGDLSVFMGPEHDTNSSLGGAEGDGTDEEDNEDETPQHGKKVSNRKKERGKAAERLQRQVKRRRARVQCLASVLAGVVDRLLASGGGIRSSAVVAAYTDWLFAKWADLPSDAGPIVLRRADDHRVVNLVRPPTIRPEGGKDGKKPAAKGGKGKAGEGKAAAAAGKEDSSSTQAGGEAPSLSYEVQAPRECALREQVRTFMGSVLALYEKQYLDLPFISPPTSDVSAEEEALEELEDMTIDYLVSKINAETEATATAEAEAAGAASSASGEGDGSIKKSTSRSKLQQRMVAAKQKSLDDHLSAGQAAVAAGNKLPLPPSAGGPSLKAPPTAPAPVSKKKGGANQNSASGDSNALEYVCRACDAGPYEQWLDCCGHLMKSGCSGFHKDKDGVAIRDACRVMQGGKKTYFCRELGCEVNFLSAKKGGGGWASLVDHLVESGHMANMVNPILNQRQRERVCSQPARAAAGRAGGGKKASAAAGKAAAATTNAAQDTGSKKKEKAAAPPPQKPQKLQRDDVKNLVSSVPGLCDRLRIFGDDKKPHDAWRCACTLYPTESEILSHIVDKKCCTALMEDFFRDVSTSGSKKRPTTPMVTRAASGNYICTSCGKSNKQLSKCVHHLMKSAHANFYQWPATKELLSTLSAFDATGSRFVGYSCLEHYWPDPAQEDELLAHVCDKKGDCCKREILACGEAGQEWYKTQHP
jgi:HrpA-like RNA helicase